MEIESFDPMIKIDAGFCGECVSCIRACPFEALTLDEKANRVVLDPEKCQACGVCYGTCPSGAITSIYYDISSLLEKVRSGLSKGVKRVVITCKASTPGTETLLKVIGEPSMDNIIHLLLPCVGRIPGDFYLKVISEGVTKIDLMPCESSHCRFEQGSIIATGKAAILRRVVCQLGYPSDTITIHHNAMMSESDADKCIGCGRCMEVCPYDAITMEDVELRLEELVLKTRKSKIDPEKCTDCGACGIQCPVGAIVVDRIFRTSDMNVGTACDEKGVG